MSQSNGMKIAFVEIIGTAMEQRVYYPGLVFTWPEDNSKHSDSGIVESVEIEGNSAVITYRAISGNWMGQLGKIVRHVAGCTICYEGEVPKTLPEGVIRDPLKPSNVVHTDRLTDEQKAALAKPAVPAAPAAAAPQAPAAPPAAPQADLDALPVEIRVQALKLQLAEAVNSGDAQTALALGDKIKAASEELVEADAAEKGVPSGL